MKKGQNLVTPDDLGRRVTFQFELPNGFVSEAVGVFERWDEEAQTYFVRKKDGTEVRIPARGVKHGKVIPDRPATASDRAKARADDRAEDPGAGPAPESPFIS
jgi:hypothetical protein